jgi:ABC-type dipeptide/oligopeptide/nickel transport system permease subunit
MTTPLPLAPGNPGFHDSVENAIELKEVEGLSQGRIVLRRFLRHRGAMVSAIILTVVVVIVTTSIGWGPIPGWWHWKPNDMPVIVNAGGVPTLTWGGGLHMGEHPFGQDNIGRDVFARVMRGTQQSLTVMVIIGLLSTTIGIAVGAVAGFFRGWIDNLIMRFTDMVITIPVIMVGAILGAWVGGANPVGAPRSR